MMRALRSVPSRKIGQYQVLFQAVPSALHVLKVAPRGVCELGTEIPRR